MNFRFSSFNSQSSISPALSAFYPASFFIRPFTVLMLAAMSLQTTVQSSWGFFRQSAESRFPRSMSASYTRVQKARPPVFRGPFDFGDGGR